MKTMLLLLGVLLPSMAFADDEQIPEDHQRVTYRLRDEYIADTVSVTGTTEGPGMGLVKGLPSLRFFAMTRVRHDFNDEMRASLHEVR